MFQGFIVQTGDPTGTGKGGTSIWGKKFEDEFKEELKVGTNLFYQVVCRDLWDFLFDGMINDLYDKLYSVQFYPTPLKLQEV